MTQARLLTFILLAVFVSGCQKAKFGHEYRLSHSDERISIRFDDAPFDPQVAAYLNSRACRSINVTNEGSAPITLDVYAFHLVKEDSFGEPSKELKVLVRDSPRPEQSAVVAPIGGNVLVVGSWSLRQVQAAPGISSTRCVDNFIDLSGEDFSLSLEWLEGAQDHA